jgi:hypothetical protein
VAADPAAGPLPAIDPAVLRNAKDPGSLYVNDQKCYKDLSDLLTRGRLDGLVPWESMHDPTRPHTGWRVWESVRPYVRKQLDTFMVGYSRDLLQSQPAYVELVVEKLTVLEIAERAAMPFRVPVGVGRGYTSTSSLEETARRFHASCKGHFILVIAGDLDPEGADISRVWPACLRDEHGVGEITVVMAGVNPDQVTRYGLSPLPVKGTSSRASGYVEAHGNNVFELEAFEPDVLQAVIRDTIRSVLNMDRFEAEKRKEAEDARYLLAYRSKVWELLKDCHPDADERGAAHEAADYLPGRPGQALPVLRRRVEGVQRDGRRAVDLPRRPGARLGQGRRGRRGVHALPPEGRRIPPVERDVRRERRLQVERRARRRPRRPSRSPSTSGPYRPR